ncbi:hypothetical protein CAOG_06087 [Capsaspora owczarzaki ATCC 30864]|uniref:CBS domain-containing protein n=1 Tax=Capsaspora owczarzaki (strain ATCC 30864) TaxID=595528 RepID=A0A0D2WTC4_CAPO3|nr:hypothetical protein CAOG_06087 [Capsaspora owczarzaki ATCC 30864]KJE95660.1 hypothetical protein CAOG_006087 [Capsaspora owczarzaki ATCC 30864]|eukprot:XP_004345677.2 hypothetical protein CAOG_06087 [Capsaspora owczarzaki ATCC 30864]
MLLSTRCGIRQMALPSTQALMASAMRLAHKSHATPNVKSKSELDRLHDEQVGSKGEDTAMYPEFQPPPRSSDAANLKRDAGTRGINAAAERFLTGRMASDLLADKAERLRTLGVVSMRETDTALDAVQRMAELNLGSVIVVPSKIGGAEGQPTSGALGPKDTSVSAMGVFTEAHYVKSVLLKGLNPARVTLGEVAARGITCVSANVPIEQVMQRFIDTRVRNLPVIATADTTDSKVSPHSLPRVVGILSMGDLHRSLVMRLNDFPFMESVLVRDVLALPESGLKFGVVDHTLDELRIDHNKSASHALELMIKHRTHVCFVHQASSFLGLLSMRSCIRAAAAGRDLKSVKVESLMETDITVVTPEFPLVQAMKALVQIERFVLPVSTYIGDTFDADMRLAGVVSVLDVLNMFHFKYHALRMAHHR